MNRSGALARRNLNDLANLNTVIAQAVSAANVCYRDIVPIGNFTERIATAHHILRTTGGFPAEAGNFSTHRRVVVKVITHAIENGFGYFLLMPTTPQVFFSRLYSSYQYL